ncbi:hypothetical protein D9M69_544080 [compost metagenome]
MRVVDLHQIRRLAAQPAADAHPLQALGDELQLAALLRGVVDAHQGAVFRQGLGVEAGGVGERAVEVEQRQALVLGVGDPLEGLRPGLLVDDHRQHLRGEERAVVDRDDVQPLGQRLGVQGQALGIADGIFFDDFGLVGHAAPGSMQ